MTPDVRMGDVWKDNDPRGGPTFVIAQVCPDGCDRRQAAHAHVCQLDGKRPRMLLLRRFVPTKRGYTLTERAGEPVQPAPGQMSWRADAAKDVLCRRCLIPGRGWTWDDDTFCEPCHRATRGDETTDLLILSDHYCFGEWWTDELLDRADRPLVTAEKVP